MRPCYNRGEILTGQRFGLTESSTNSIQILLFLGGFTA